MVLGGRNVGVETTAQSGGIPRAGAVRDKDKPVAGRAVVGAVCFPTSPRRAYGEEMMASRPPVVTKPGRTADKILPEGSTMPSMTYPAPSVSVFPLPANWIAVPPVPIMAPASKMLTGCAVLMSTPAEPEITPKLIGAAGTVANVASMHGVSGLTRSAALQYATQGIRVNAVAPGLVHTPLTDG